MDPMTKDPIIAGATSTGQVAGTIIAIHDGDIPRGFVKLHANLVGAWDDLDEVKRALEIDYLLTSGPHPAIAGYPEGGNPHWLGVDILDLQTDYYTRTDRDMPREELIGCLTARCCELAALLQSASAYKKGGMSVRPAKLDYDEERIRGLAGPIEMGELAVIALRKGELAWTPGTGYMYYRGPGNAKYLFTTEGVEADFTREFD